MAKQPKKKKPPRERTVYHLRLPDLIHAGIRKRAANRGVTMNEIQDEACGWFLKFRGRKAYTGYVAAHRGSNYRSMWIDSRISERLRKVAERDFVTNARVLHTALALYLREIDK